MQYATRERTLCKRHVLGVILLVLALATLPPAGAQTIKTNVIFGSSVAQGGNADGEYNGHWINGSFWDSYGALLTQMLASNGWWVMNVSESGADTSKAIGLFPQRVPIGVDEVFIGLSLGNEHLDGSPNPQATCNQFYSGISTLIAMTIQNGSLPVLGSVYPKDDFSPNEYVYLKNMVLQFNSLGFPFANFLGATDNGYGHWIPAMDTDGSHPNDFGHYEMFLAIVPSVFDAVKAGKPTPQWGDPSRFVRIVGDPQQLAPLSFSPGSTVHSFAMSFAVRTSQTGTVASVTLPGSIAQPTIEITPSDLIYVATNGQVVSSGVTATDGAWHNVVLSHQYARGQTWFYVDGALAGTVSEQLTPICFVLGGHGSAAARPGSPAQADYQNWFVHRSMLNVEEVTAQYHGSLQQESLEFYSPLDDPSFPPGGTLSNRAQSLSTAAINGALLSATPTVTFSASPTLGLAPLAVTFTDTSSIPITNWFWAFGDGGTTNLATNTVLYTYATAGVYTVTEVVTGPGGSVTLAQSNDITATFPPASFIATPTNGVAPLVVTLTDTSIASLTNWSWSFGDGSATNLATNVVSHAYTTAGVYTVTETVTGPAGSSSSTQSNCINVLAMPLSTFSATPTNGSAPLTVTFTDTSPGPITNWFWSFGDGGTTNLATNTVVYTYATAGVYTVTEFITGPGQTAGATKPGYIYALTSFQGWQTQFFGPTNLPTAAPTADADGTGQNNQFKYVAGLDPTNSASVFLLTISSDTNLPPNHLLQFMPVADGRTYTPQFTTNLPTGVWRPLTTYAGPVTNGGTQVSIIDTNLTAPQQFYRIAISWPLAGP
ncbi:MAG TPA: PKD domain-containing protein [Verrucomicrobiae bacterium]|nr:PKD domain-containing protein [Verrucomicrobiae bacterium]